MGAWRNSKPVNKSDLPPVFYVKPGALKPCVICNRTFLSEVRRSPSTGNIYAELTTGKRVLVSLEKTVLEFGTEILKEFPNLADEVNWKWLREQGIQPPSSTEP